MIRWTSQKVKKHLGPPEPIHCHGPPKEKNNETILSGVWILGQPAGSSLLPSLLILSWYLFLDHFSFLSSALEL